MRAIRIHRHGGVEALERVTLDPPTAAAGEVQVRVTHVGLNHLDVWVRRGVPGHRFPLPLVPGSDVVGVRLDTGAPVALIPATACLTCLRCLEGRNDLCRQFQIRGETVDGGCQEIVVARPDQLLPLGPLQPEAAAALPLSLLTAWHLLARAGVRPGHRVVVQAGASGVGSLAVQVARHLGAHVAATGSTPERRSLAVKLGAEQVWPYEDAVTAARAWAPDGVDIVVEHVGADTFASSLRLLRRGGTLVTCGATTGHLVNIDLRAIFFKQLSIIGSTMGTFAEMHTAWDAALSGHIRPVVQEVLPMSRIADAHLAIEQRRVLGKLVLEQDL